MMPFHGPSVAIVALNCFLRFPHADCQSGATVSLELHKMSRRSQPAPGTRYEVAYTSPGGQPARGVVWLCGQNDAADDAFMTQHNIVFVVKTSGDADGQKPRAYGRNNGRQPVIANLTVNYWKSFGRGSLAGWW